MLCDVKGNVFYVFAVMTYLKILTSTNYTALSQNSQDLAHVAWMDNPHREFLEECNHSLKKITNHTSTEEAL